MAQNTVLELKRNTTNKIPSGSDKPLSEKIKDLQRAIEILDKMDQHLSGIEHRKQNG